MTRAATTSSGDCEWLESRGEESYLGGPSTLDKDASGVLFFN